MRRIAIAAATVLLVAGCTSGGGAASSTVAPAGTPTPPASSPAPTADSFAGLPYRLDLPAGWIALGSPDYETAVDSAPAVADWLDRLDLVGVYAFRAYEPLAGAAGMRIAVNPQSPWRAESPVLLDEGQVAALPGVTGRPVGDMVGIGQDGKATRFSWTEAIDWGGGAPAARSVAGYYVMAGAHNPVYVVVSWPAETDRLAEAEALLASFVVFEDPVMSPPPGVSMPPSPTPFDKLASPPPAQVTPAPHGATALEALLPDEAGGAALAKSSWTGVDRGMTDSDPLLAPFGKHPADYQAASATPSEPPLFAIGVQRVDGVAGKALLAVVLKQMPDAKVSDVTVAGKDVAYVEYGAWPVWYYATGDMVFMVAGLPDTVAAVLATLP
jgi:hypothetical protein